jgi:hypothetical protein
MHSPVVRVAVPHDLHHTRQDDFFRVRNKKEGTFSSSDGTVGTVPQLSGKNGGRFASIRSTGGGAASAPDPTRPDRAPPARASTLTSGYGRSPSTHGPPHPTFCLLVVGARADNVTPGLCIYLFIFHSSSTDGDDTSPPAWAAQSRCRCAAAMPCTKSSGSVYCVALCLHATEHFCRLQEGARRTRVPLLSCRAPPAQ